MLYPCKALLINPNNQTRSKKNVATDMVGDKMGKIHLGRQDLDELQTRKMKGLKRSRDALAANNGEEEDVDLVSRSDDTSEDDIDSGEIGIKRPRLSS